MGSAAVGAPAALEEDDSAHGGKPWMVAAPHLPAPELEEACYNAAYTEGASGNSAGTVILTSGDAWPLLQGSRLPGA